MQLTFDPPIHPGEVLKEEYLVPLNMSAGALAHKLRVPRTRIERVVAQQSPITIDTALRLAKFFRTSPRFWTNMQAAYDLAVVAKEKQAELSAIPEMPQRPA